MVTLSNFTYNSSTSTNSSPLSTPNSSNSTSPEFEPHHRLVASLFREEGHIYSLATAGNMLYTGSESNSVRVWKNLKDFSGFKSKSGMVKAIVVLNHKVFTGHQDGKIRVWTLLDDKSAPFNQVGHFPKTRHLLRSYVRARRNRIKHCDTVSCMAVDENHGLLYSGSWDKTLKIWRISDSKCLESVAAHDDAVNSVAALGGVVFTGSADGTVKAWRRDFVGRRTEHSLAGVLLQQDHAVTALAAAGGGGAVYAGTSDGLVRFWEVGKRVAPCGGVLRGHKMAVLCLAAAGSLVMSGSADKSICVWRRGSGDVHECVAVLTGHGGPVKCLAAEEDEESRRRWIVYSGSLDKSVKIWRVSE